MLLSLALLTAASAPHEVVVGVDAAGACRVTFDAKPFPAGDDAHAITRLRSMGGTNRRVTVRSDPAGGNVTYRCIGGTIYALQRAGYDLKIAIVGNSRAARYVR